MKTPLRCMLALVIGVALGPSTASAFTLDPSLAGGGLDRIPVGDRDYSRAQGLAIMADGRTVIGGIAQQGDRTLGGLLRLLPNGEPDTTFAPATSFPGQVFVDAAPTDEPDRRTLIRDVEVAGDGSIYVAGEVAKLYDADDQTYTRQPFVAHVLADGTMDPAIQQSGYGPGVRTLLDSGNSAVQLLAAPGGGFYVLGNVTGSANGDNGVTAGINSEALIVSKLNGDLTADAAYGSGGHARLDPMNTSQGYEYSFGGNDIALDAQGRVVVGGVALMSGFVGMVARFTTSGQLDASFGGEGVQPTSPPGIPGVELAGPAPSGTYDPETQDGTGSSLDTVQALAIQPDGRIVTAGTGTGAGAAIGQVGRFTADGKRDTAFGDKGFLVFRAQSEPDKRGANHATQLQAVALEGDRIIVAGSVDTLTQTASEQRGGPKPDLLVAAVTSAGKLDIAEGTNGPIPGTFVTPVGGDRLAVTTRVVTAGGKVHVSGYASAPPQNKTFKFPDTPGNPSSFLLARLGNGPAGTAPPAPVDPNLPAPCKDATTVTVRSAALIGCFSTKNGVSTSVGRVLMNGTTIDVGNGTTLVATPGKGTIFTQVKGKKGGTARVTMTTPKGVSVPVSKGPLDFTVPKKSSRAKIAAEGDCDKGGSRIGTVNTSGVGNLIGFPLGGLGEVRTANGTTYIQVNVSLPKPLFKSASGCAALITTTTGGLALDSLHIDVGTANLGPLDFGNVAIDYTGKSDTWIGSLELNLDLPRPVGLTGSIAFQNGDFAAAQIGLTGPPVPIFPPVSLAGINAGVKIKPFTSINGGVHLIAGPQLFGTAAIDADVQGAISFPGSPYAIGIDITGSVRVVKIPVGSAAVHYDTGGTFTLKGNASFDALLASVDVDVKGGVQGKHFFLEGAAKACAGGDLACLVAAALVSEKGAAACGGFTSSILPDLLAGGAVEWADFPSVDFFEGCDLAPYETFKVARLAPLGSTAQVGDQTFTVEPGTKAIGLKVKGASATPLISVVGPNGERIDGPTKSIDPPLHRSDVAESPSGQIISWRASQASYVLLAKPAAGTWRIVPQLGTAAIASVERSTVLPQPKVSARVLKGKGRRRLLRFKRTRRKGESVVFVERTAKLDHRIGETDQGNGVIRFSPVDGKPGRRSIVALISQGGLPRTSKIIASYRAPGPAKPGRVKRLKLRAKGGSAVKATWAKTKGAAKYLVRVSLKDGHRATVLTTGRSATFAAFLPKRGGTVTVVPRSKAGLTGKTSKAKLKVAKKKKSKKKKKKS